MTDWDRIEVTGLVLHFRTPEKTLDCLRSQHQEGIRRVVIVDNSEDGGRSVLAMEEGLEVLRRAGLVAEILQPGRNLGFSAGVNLGLGHVATRSPGHVLLINSDARLMPGAIAHLRDVLSLAPIVAPRIAQGRLPPSSPIAYYDRLLALITTAPKVLPLPHVSGCCLLIRQDHARPPLFDEDFFFYGDDVMLGYAAQQSGVVQRECREAVVQHATSSSSQNGSAFYEYHLNRAHLLLSRKLAQGTLQRLIFALARGVVLPLRASVRSIRLRSLVPWRGLLMACADVLRHRYRSLTPADSNDG